MVNLMTDDRDDDDFKKFFFCNFHLNFGIHFVLVFWSVVLVCCMFAVFVTCLYSALSSK